MSTKNTYKKLTDRIIEMIENDLNPWDCGFEKAAVMRPVNGATKNEYSGINVINLSIAQYTEGFTHNVWFTYNQAKKLGGNVKAGQKSVADVYFYKLIDKRTPAEKSEHEDLRKNHVRNERTAELNKKVFLIARSFAVFNLDQTENIDPEKISDLIVETKAHDHEPIVVAENIVAEMPNKPAIEFGGNQPSYNPRADVVKMPELAKYKKAERFYKTLFHELAHSTGHETRLNRDGVAGFNGFGTETYSFEELVAELSASFISNIAGIANDELDENTAAYLKGWIEPLQNDTKMIVKAMGKAIEAVDYITNKETETVAE